MDMFCERCGKPVDTDRPICDECAAKAQAENGAFTHPENGNIVLDWGREEPKKKKTGLLIGIVAAVAALAALLVVLCMGPLKGLWLKNFGSPEAYMLYVEEKAAAGTVQNIVQLYAETLKQTDGLEEASADTQMHILIGDKLLTLMEQNLMPEGERMDYLSDIAINMNTSWDQDLFAIKMDLGLGEKSVVDLALFADPKAETAIIGIPALNPQYIQLPMEGVTNPSSAYAMYRLLPASENVAAVLKTYTGLIMKYMDKVEKSAETVTVEGVEQELTVLTLTVTAQDVSNMVIEIMETAQTDKDLETVLDALSEYVNAVNGQEFDNVDFHADMIESIPDAIEEVRESADELTEGDYLQLTDYVDSDHNLCGRAVEMFTDHVSDGSLRYLTITDGKKYALELDMTDIEDAQLYVSGEYTNVDGVVNGSFDITAANVNYMTVELTNCTGNQLQMKLIPTDAFLKDVLELDASVSSLLGLASPYLEIISDSTEQTSGMELYLKTGNAMLAGITIDATVSKEANIDVPRGPYIDSEDSEAVTDWAGSLDIIKLMDNLVDAGVPKDLLDALLRYLVYG